MDVSALKEHESEKLLERVLSQVEKYEIKARYFRHWTYFIRFSTFFLAGMITVLAGWKSTDPSLPLQNWILICGAISTFLISVAAFWNVERHWIANILTAQKLKRLRDQVRRLGYKEASPTKNEISRLWESYDEILDSRVEYWEGILNNHTN